MSLKENNYYTPLFKKYFRVGEYNVRETKFSLVDSTALLMSSSSERIFSKSSRIVLSGRNLADSFLKRGASAVIGWDGLIGFRDNDRVILELLEKILSDGEDISNAVESTKENFVFRTQYSPTLKYFLNNGV